MSVYPPPKSRDDHDYPNVDPKTGRNPEAEAELERLYRWYNEVTPGCRFDICIYGPISNLASHVTVRDGRFGPITFSVTLGQPPSDSDVPPSPSPAWDEFLGPMGTKGIETFYESLERNRRRTEMKHESTHFYFY